MIVKNKKPTLHEERETATGDKLGQESEASETEEVRTQN